MKSFCILLFSLLIAGCSFSTTGTETPGILATLPDPQITTVSAPDAEQTTTDFLVAWGNRDFEQMYAMLNPGTQATLSKTAFFERYEDVSRTVQLIGIEHEIVSSLIAPDKAQVRYRITLQSAILGDITRETWMDLERSSDIWKVAWTDTTILPEFTAETNLLMAPVVPTRANVYDVNGLALATETDTVALYLTPNEVGGEDAEEAMLVALSRLLGRSQESILNLYDDIREFNWYVHLGEVSFAEFQPYEATLNAVGGVKTQPYTSRYYFSEGLAPHSVGYVSWIPEAELDSYLRQGYIKDEFVGQIGVERVYEDALRGVQGGTLYLADSEGQLLQTIAQKDSEPPLAVYTNLDRDLQRQAQEAIAGFTGVIVVIERDSGAVKAIVSSPGFDPNLFEPSHPYASEGLQEIFNNSDNPLFNRSTHGAYPLGSVFKIITMAAGMESGLFQRDTIRDCPLEWNGLPGITLTDWRLERELAARGEITLLQALEGSCNTYFYQIGLELFNEGFETAISDMAAGFGLGESADLEIGDEMGLIPNPTTKLERFGEPWGPQDVVELAIGQSFLEVTPLQVARYIAAIGNGGTLYRPQIINKIQSAEGEIVLDFQPDAQAELPISSETLEAIQEAMFMVTSSPQGTARLVLRYPFTLSIKTAGKTGTATTGDFTESHAWFGGYTFEEREGKPDIAVVVIVEFEGEGSTWAAPIFRRVVESYFFGKPQTLYRWESRIGVPSTPTPTPDPEDQDPEATAES